MMYFYSASYVNENGSGYVNGSIKCNKIINRKRLKIQFDAISNAVSLDVNCDKESVVVISLNRL